MSSTKSALRYLAAFAIIFILVYLLPVSIHRSDFDRAFLMWSKNRTPQSEAALRTEQYKNETIELEGCAVVALIVLVVAGGVYKFVGFMRRSASDNNTRD